MTEPHLRNATWGALSAAIRALGGMLNALLAVKLLGLQSYGLIATLFSVFSLYLSLNTSVFTMLVVNLMASDRTSEQYPKVLGGAFLAFIVALILLFVVAAMVYFFGELAFFGTAAVGLSTPIFVLIVGMTGLQIASAFQASLLESSGWLHLALKLQLLTPCFVAGGLLLNFFLAGRMSAENYLELLVFGAFLEFALLWYARKSRGDWVHAPLFSIESVGVVKELLRSAALLQGAFLMNLFLEPASKLLLNYYLGAEPVSIYDLVMKVIWGVQNLFSAAMRVFLHIGSQNPASLGSGFHRVFRLVFVPAVLMHVAGAMFLTVVGHDWLSIPTGQLLSFYSIATCSNLMMIFVTPLYIGLIGRGDLVFIFRTQSILAVTNVGISLLMIPTFGLLGAAVGLLLATIYNATAIIWRARADIGGGGYGRPSWSRWEVVKAVISLTLLALTISWGLHAYEQWAMLGLLLGLLVALGVSEPLASLLFQRLCRFPRNR